MSKKSKDVKNNESEVLTPDENIAGKTDVVPYESEQGEIVDVEKTLSEAMEMLDIGDFLKDFYNEDGTPIGQEDEDLRTLRKPYIRLGQLTSREGEPGKYHDNFTGEDWDSFVAAIFSPKLAAIKFPKEYDGKAKPLCRSENGIVSVDGKRCADCPDNYNVFGPNGERPRCSKVIALLGWNISNQRFFVLPLRGKALSQLSLYQSELKFNKNRAPYFFFETKIGTKLIQDDKGKYYIPTFEIVKDYTEELKELAEQLQKAIKDRNAEAVKKYETQIKIVRKWLQTMKNKLEDTKNIFVTDIIVDEMRETGTEDEYEDNDDGAPVEIVEATGEKTTYEKTDSDAF